MVYKAESHGLRRYYLAYKRLEKNSHKLSHLSVATSLLRQIRPLRLADPTGT
jgi:hypothetical protein